MFKFDSDIPTYAEWKTQLEKITKDQPEQAKKYQEQIQKFWQDFYEDALSPFKIKNNSRQEQHTQKTGQNLTRIATGEQQKFSMCSRIGAP